MADVRIRIEVGFHGGGTLGALISEPEFAEFRQSLQSRDDRVVELEADDGHYLIAVSHVDYVKRFSRETHIGFGGTG